MKIWIKNNSRRNPIVIKNKKKKKNKIKEETITLYWYTHEYNEQTLIEDFSS